MCLDQYSKPRKDKDPKAETGGTAGNRGRRPIWLVESLELYITAGIRERPSWVAKEQVCEETGSFLLGMSQVRCLTVTGVVVLTSQWPTVKLLSTPIALHKIKKQLYWHRMLPFAHYTLSWANFSHLPFPPPDISWPPLSLWTSCELQVENCWEFY